MGNVVPFDNNIGLFGHFLMKLFYINKKYSCNVLGHLLLAS